MPRARCLLDQMNNGYIRHATAPNVSETRACSLRIESSRRAIGLAIRGRPPAADQSRFPENSIGNCPITNSCALASIVYPSCWHWPCRKASGTRRIRRKPPCAVRGSLRPSILKKCRSGTLKTSRCSGPKWWAGGIRRIRLAASARIMPGRLRIRSWCGRMVGRSHTGSTRLRKNAYQFSRTLTITCSRL